MPDDALECNASARFAGSQAIGFSDGAHASAYAHVQHALQNKNNTNRSVSANFPALAC